jgi:hypothetical protein
MKLRIFCDVLIALMMEAARTSETSVDIQLRTWQYIPEDSELRRTRSFGSDYYRLVSELGSQQYRQDQDVNIHAS